MLGDEMIDEAQPQDGAGHLGQGPGRRHERTSKFEAPEALRRCSSDARTRSSRSARSTSTGPGKTVTEYDDHLFCLLTMNHHPLHMDANYAREDHRLRQERRGRATTSTPCCSACRCRTSRARRSPTGGRVAQARGADLPRRHDLRRDDRPRQEAVEVEERPRASSTWRPGATSRTAPGLRLPPQGDGPHRDLRQGARRRAAGARPSRARLDRRPRGEASQERAAMGRLAQTDGLTDVQQEILSTVRELRRQGDPAGRHRAGAPRRVPAPRSSRASRNWASSG